jgi:hypothetical protein
MRPLVLLLLLTACTRFPELDAAVDTSALDAPYPDLVPIEQLLEPAPRPGSGARVEPDVAETLQSRAAGLQSRARNLGNTPVMDDETRDRLARARAAQ